jgi:type IV pilus assembly protein PilE
MRNTRQRGFTLLELMIVVAVIALLAAIAMPMYIEQIRKGKRAEAAQVIGDIQLRQERFRADNPTYGTLDQLTGSAANSTAYNNALKNYTVTVTNNTGTSYTITATRKGDLASDPKCGNFTLTRAIVAPATIPTEVKGISSGDSKYCWRN